MIGGQIGWDEHGNFPEGFVAQAAQALRNVLAVVREAGGGPEHIARLTWYVVDIEEYRSSLPARSGLSRHSRPLVSGDDPGAGRRPGRARSTVEIEATAILPD